MTCHNFVILCKIKIFCYFITIMEMYTIFFFRFFLNTMMVVILNLIFMKINKINLYHIYRNIY